MHMTTRKLAATAALLLGTTLAMSSTSFAQYYDDVPYYNLAPGYATGYGYGGPGLYSLALAPGLYDDGFSPPNCDRGGPGPRVSCGSGEGIGADR